jgi:hypothetical protein
MGLVRVTAVLFAVLAIVSVSAARTRTHQSQRIQRAPSWGRELGPLRLGSPVPQSFLGCAPAFTSDTIEHRYYVPDPQHPETGARVEIASRCQSKRKGGSCAPGAPRVAGILTVTTAPAYDLLDEGNCTLPVPLGSLRTSRDIRLGDTESAVLRAYGTPSTTEGGAQGSADYYRVVYRNSGASDGAPAIDFAIQNHVVVEIRIRDSA